MYIVFTWRCALFRAADTNTLRILVATDCHVGYLENDEIRRFDSFNAFEEICSIASQRQVWFLSSVSLALSFIRLLCRSSL